VEVDQQVQVAESCLDLVVVAEVLVALALAMEAAAALEAAAGLFTLAPLGMVHMVDQVAEVDQQVETDQDHRPTVLLEEEEVADGEPQEGLAKYLVVVAEPQ
jgi:hypothetical protein